MYDAATAKNVGIAAAELASKCACDEACNSLAWRQVIADD
jgi:hypothetical protein